MTGASAESRLSHPDSGVWGFSADIGEDLCLGEIEVRVELQTRFEGGLWTDTAESKNHTGQERRAHCQDYRNEQRASGPQRVLRSPVMPGTGQRTT